MITFRKAETKDLSAIASLHALSWKTAYKGIMNEKFLTEEVLNDRLKTWKERFRHLDKYFIWLAEKEGELVGFVCLITKPDENKGYLLDNIHVHPAMKGLGTGKELFHKALAVSRKFSPRYPMYLWVFDMNKEAIQFYEKQGGLHFETIKDKAPDGRIAAIRRYVWKHP